MLLDLRYISRLVYHTFDEDFSFRYLSLQCLHFLFQSLHPLITRVAFTLPSISKPVPPQSLPYRKSSLQFPSFADGMYPGSFFFRRKSKADLSKEWDHPLVPSTVSQKRHYHSSGLLRHDLLPNPDLFHERLQLAITYQKLARLIDEVQPLTTMLLNDLRRWSSSSGSTSWHRASPMIEIHIASLKQWHTFNPVVSPRSPFQPVFPQLCPCRIPGNVEDLGGIDPELLPLNHNRVWPACYLDKISNVLLEPHPHWQLWLLVQFMRWSFGHA